MFVRQAGRALASALYDSISCNGAPPRCGRCPCCRRMDSTLVAAHAASCDGRRCRPPAGDRLEDQPGQSSSLPDPLAGAQPGGRYCDAPPPGALAGLLQSDAEHRLEVVLRVDLEGDVRVGLSNARDLRELRRDDVGDLLMIFDPEDRHEVELPGHRVGFRHARDVGEGRPELGDCRPLRLNQNDGGNHEGILSPRWEELKDLDTTNICSYNIQREDGGGGSVGEDPAPTPGCGPGTLP